MYATIVYVDYYFMMVVDVDIDIIAECGCWLPLSFFFSCMKHSVTTKTSTQGEGTHFSSIFWACEGFFRSAEYLYR